MTASVFTYWHKLIASAFIAASVISGSAHFVYAQDFELDENQFNHWVFRNGSRDDDTESQLTLAVESVDRVCHLSDEQKAKLRLAACGDFARFDQDCDKLRSELVGKTYDQNKIGEVYQQIQPLAQRYQAGLLGRSSLFIKVARSTLTPEQLAEFGTAEQERLRARHVANVKLFVATLEKRCPLNDQQRTSLVELLVAETQPPLRPSQLDAYVVSAQAAKIPQERYKAILDDAQYRVLDKTLQRGRGLMGHLQREGVLPDD